jgi:hypothetical protein
MQRARCITACHVTKIAAPREGAERGNLIYCVGGTGYVRQAERHRNQRQSPPPGRPPARPSHAACHPNTRWFAVFSMRLALYRPISRSAKPCRGSAGQHEDNKETPDPGYDDSPFPDGGGRLRTCLVPPRTEQGVGRAGNGSPGRRIGPHLFPQRPPSPVRPVHVTPPETAPAQEEYGHGKG